MTYIALEELNHLWYPDEIVKFGELCMAGMDITEMAKALRRSEDEVMVLIIDIKRFGMSTFQLIQEHERWDRTIAKNSIIHLDEEKIREAFYKAKGTLDDIAFSLGLKKSTLAHYIIRRRKEDPKRWPRKKETQPKTPRKRGKKT